MSFQDRSAALTESVRSIASRLESDRAKKIDPAETWASVKGAVEQHKSDVQNDQESTHLEHMYVALIEDLTALAEDLHARAIAKEGNPDDENVRASPLPAAGEFSHPDD